MRQIINQIVICNIYSILHPQRLMTQIERRFRKIITWFGALPGIFVPILVIGILHYIIPISSSEITAISTVSVLINSIMIMTIVGI